MPSASWQQIGVWMVGLLGSLAALVLILTAIRLVRALFEKNPPVETFVKELDSKLKTFDDRLHEFRDELKLDGTRRSKTLFDHIRTENAAIVQRVAEHDRQIARLEERTKNHHGH